MSLESNKKIAEVEAVPINDSVNDPDLLDSWLLRLHDAQRGHYSRSESLYMRASFTGYALIISSTIVTGMLFFNADGIYKVVQVVMSILAASLSGVVSFARFAEQAEQHRSAAGCYGKLRRQLEKLNYSKASFSKYDFDRKLKILKIEWEYTSQNAPLTPLSSINKFKNAGSHGAGSGLAFCLKRTKQDLP